jgi:hypothetical protein
VRASLEGVLFDEAALAALKPGLPRGLYRELWGRDLVVAVDLRKALYGLVNDRVKNMLVYDFWALAFAYLYEVNTDFVNTAGTWNPGGYLLRSSGDVNYASAFLAFGTSTSPPAFSQYALGGRSTALEGAAITPGIVSEADKRRLRFGRVSAGALNEVGLYQNLYDTAGYVRECMLGRVVYSVPGSGYNVYYDVIVKAPFLHNFAAYLFGLLSETNQALVGRTGASFTARTAGDANAGGLYVIVGTSNAPFNFSQYELTSPLVLTSAANFTFSRGSYVMIVLSGAARLPTAMSIGEVGFAQRIYDTGGAANECLLGRIPLSTPISRAAGDVFSCVITFYAGA